MTIKVGQKILTGEGQIREQADAGTKKTIGVRSGFLCLLTRHERIKILVENQWCCFNPLAGAGTPRLLTFR
ncbi:hypothetical protein DUU06_22935 [Salmonella enterica subsp. enterica serovar Enteritidis]|uniref:Uncharacterized protein n=1 Tax=Salmonella enteritidis TaxID=149539 RepID=A0A5V0BD05_SALEN|nr:hypothetical protein [Salmonella enterica subsp. enterica serovar Enteritidis]ECA1252745.1 hypothetical protein [Salmonella enterica subsp. enterica serovar Chailey]